MLEVGVVLSALSMAVASAALTLAVLLWRGGGERRPPQEGESEESGTSAALSEKRMQEGIANLLSYQALGGKEEE